MKSAIHFLGRMALVSLAAGFETASFATKIAAAPVSAAAVPNYYDASAIQAVPCEPFLDKISGCAQLPISWQQLPFDWKRLPFDWKQFSVGCEQLRFGIAIPSALGSEPSPSTGTGTSSNPKLSGDQTNSTGDTQPDQTQPAGSNSSGGSTTGNTVKIDTTGDSGNAVGSNNTGSGNNGTGRAGSGHTGGNSNSGKPSGTNSTGGPGSTGQNGKPGNSVHAGGARSEVGFITSFVVAACVAAAIL
ncbi:hypothetical protein V2A60_007122 [Cordyceps javanica]